MRILVIDDDPGVRLLCRIAFRAEHYEVFEAPNGQEGLELLASEGADAVVLDVMLPNLDGLDVLRRIRADVRTSDVPVVLLSAKARVEDQIEGWRAGADEYLTKPFSPSTLTATVDGICRTDPRERTERRAGHLRESVSS
jgi:DNA-binding response OmpR family regulator